MACWCNLPEISRSGSPGGVSIRTLGILLASVATLSCDTPDCALRFVEDYEGGSGYQRAAPNLLFPGTRMIRDIHGEGELEIVSTPVRAGKHAASFKLAAEEDRVELRVPGEVPIGAERWYGFSVFLPEDWAPEPRYVLVSQWHARPDEGEPGRSPPLGLLVSGESWKLWSRWDDRPLTPAGADLHLTELWTGPIERGRWTDWVIHARWSFGPDGSLEVWKDGERIVEHAGPNCYNDRRGLYFKWGLYHTQRNRGLFNDELRIGDHWASYACVDPAARAERP